MFVAGGAEGRTSDTETRCASAEASTPKVRPPARRPAGLLGLQTCCVSRIICSLCLRAVEKRLRETLQFGVEGSSTFLECQPRSPQASVKWLFQGEGKRKLVGRLNLQ